jgi:hypothetical protein
VELLQVVPTEAAIPLAEVVAWMRPESQTAAEPPFGRAVLAFCDSLSRVLLRHPEASRYPEILAVGFCMRRAALSELEREFAAVHTPDTLLVPHGMVFHIPPSNVDTIFLYSWLLSVVAGNRNLIRLSSRTTPQVELLCRLYTDVLREHPTLAGNTRMIRYGHEMEITHALSQACDVRVVWGGDDTVNAVREAPLAPGGRELTFPDRFAMAALRAETVLDLDDAKMSSLAADFFNDTYWFDQAACSSPRIVVWVGGPEPCRAASARLRDALGCVVREKKYVLPAGLALEKLTFACRSAIDLAVTAFTASDATLMSLSLADLRDLPREHCGGGLFFEGATSSLMDLVPAVRRKDQTLTHFGFSREDLFALARALNGRGIDRMVPIGQALNFHRYWDGYDLLQQLTRRIHIRGQAAGPLP